MIAVLAGGTGAAKFLRGLAGVVPPESIAVIVNTGDDLDWWGLRVCPDIDTITYCLAGMLDEHKGWGVADDTFTCLDQMQRFGQPTWFNLGDRDLALHMYRTHLLREGASLTQVTQRVARQLQVRSRILPMCDDSVRTVVHTPKGELSFQEFFVRDQFEPPVTGVEYRTDAPVRAGAEVLAVLNKADRIIIPPSNPITSIGPLLSVSGIGEALSNARVLAISPIVGCRAVSGPAGKLMNVMGLEASAVGVAAAYRSWLDIMVAHRQDEPLRDQLEAMGITARFTDTLMPDAAAARRLAGEVLNHLGAAPVRSHG